MPDDETPAPPPLTLGVVAEPPRIGADVKKPEQPAEPPMWGYAPPPPAAQDAAKTLMDLPETGKMTAEEQAEVDGLMNETEQGLADLGAQIELLDQLLE
jgi:hypothetical protein